MGGCGVHVGKMMRGQESAARASREYSRNRRDSRDWRSSSAFHEDRSRTPLDAACVNCGVLEADAPLFGSEDGFRCTFCEATIEDARDARTHTWLSAGTAWAWAGAAAMCGGLLTTCVVSRLLDLGVSTVVIGLAALLTPAMFSIGGYAVLTGLRELGHSVRPDEHALVNRGAHALHLSGAIAATLIGLYAAVLPIVVCMGRAPLLD